MQDHEPVGLSSCTARGQISLRGSAITCTPDPADFQRLMKRDQGGGAGQGGGGAKRSRAQSPELDDPVREEGPGTILEKAGKVDSEVGDELCWRRRRLPRSAPLTEIVVKRGLATHE